MANPRVKAITKLYYSNPKIQKAIFDFSKDREVVPSYNMESFGKRPDSLQYPADIMAAVNKGATSFHSSEEIWHNPLEINSDMSQSDMNSLRKSWDLLIDVDSPYLDFSKIATRLLIKALEKHGIVNYGVKFSGSKGFHLIVPGKAFPEEFQEQKRHESFPVWPRAICGFLMEEIKKEYNEEISKDEWTDSTFKALKERTGLTEEDITEIPCPNCNKSAKKGNIVNFVCNRCKQPYMRKNYKITKRKLKCNDIVCPGFYEVFNQEELFSCDDCGYSSLDKKTSGRNTITYERAVKFREGYSEDFSEERSGEMMGSADIVLVSPRHLFRMPYSLHEKTVLASIVLTKDEIPNFNPRTANPLNVEVKNFYPESEKDEAKNLLATALEWAKNQETQEETRMREKYKDMKFEDVDYSHLTPEQFPRTIKKLLKGLQDGRKRGLFILLTFLKSIGYSPEKINETCRDWNKKNQPPLKEGYLKSQVDWHLKQKRKILPPNYSNQSFYKDLKLFDKKPDAKNPLSEIRKK